MRLEHSLIKSTVQACRDIRVAICYGVGPTHIAEGPTFLQWKKALMLPVFRHPLSITKRPHQNKKGDESEDPSPPGCY